MRDRLVEASRGAGLIIAVFGSFGLVSSDFG